MYVYVCMYVYVLLTTCRLCKSKLGEGQCTHYSIETGYVYIKVNIIAICS